MKLKEALDFKKMDTRQLLAQYKRSLAGLEHLRIAHGVVIFPAGYEGLFSRATVKKMEKEFAASQAAMKKELGTRDIAIPRAR